jgi:hypothetical protein
MARGPEWSLAATSSCPEGRHFDEVGEQIAIVEVDIEETITEPGQSGCIVNGTYEVELPGANSYEARAADWDVSEAVMQRSELEADGDWSIEAFEVE